MLQASLLQWFLLLGSLASGCVGLHSRGLLGLEHRLTAVARTGLVAPLDVDLLDLGSNLCLSLYCRFLLPFSFTRDAPSFLVLKIKVAIAFTILY